MKNFKDTVDRYEKARDAGSEAGVVALMAFGAAGIAFALFCVQLVGL